MSRMRTQLEQKITDHLIVTVLKGPQPDLWTALARLAWETNTDPATVEALKETGVDALDLEHHFGLPDFQKIANEHV